MLNFDKKILDVVQVMIFMATVTNRINYAKNTPVFFKDRIMFKRLSCWDLCRGVACMNYLNIISAIIILKTKKHYWNFAKVLLCWP